MIAPAGDTITQTARHNHSNRHKPTRMHLHDHTYHQRNHQAHSHSTITVISTRVARRPIRVERTMAMATAVGSTVVTIITVTAIVTETMARITTKTKTTIRGEFTYGFKWNVRVTLDPARQRGGKHQYLNFLVDLSRPQRAPGVIISYYYY